MGNQQSGSGGGGAGGGKKSDKEKKRYEPPIPTRVGKKRKKTKGPETAAKLPQVLIFGTLSFKNNTYKVSNFKKTLNFSELQVVISHYYSRWM